MGCVLIQFSKIDIPKLIQNIFHILFQGFALSYSTQRLTGCVTGNLLKTKTRKVKHVNDTDKKLSIIQKITPNGMF